MGDLKSNCGSVFGLQGTDSRGTGEGLPTLTVTTILVRLRGCQGTAGAAFCLSHPTHSCAGLFWSGFGSDVPAAGRVLGLAQGCGGASCLQWAQGGFGGCHWGHRAVSELWGGSQAELHLRGSVLCVLCLP